jgi:ElaA protein
MKRLATETVSSPAVDWHFCRYGALSLDDLYDALQLRCQVFVLEQGPYLDPDGMDRHSWHLLGRQAGAGVHPCAGQQPAAASTDPSAAAAPLLAYLRIVDPGVRFAEPSVGRVITAPGVRGTGLGRQLMHEGLRRCAEVWPGRPVRISAQARLSRFYAALGFAAEGPVYDEDGIPHQEMVRPAERPHGA